MSKYVVEFESSIMNSGVVATYYREYVVKDFYAAFGKAYREVEDAMDFCDEFEYHEIKSIVKVG